MIEGRHKDTATETKHKSGWQFSNYIFETSHFAYRWLSIKACDEEHAWKQARKFAKDKGIETINMKGLHHEL